jgi:hypothetical protein
MFERIRGQTKNEYVEVYTNDDDSDTGSVIDSKKQKILDTTEAKSEHSLAYEVYVLCFHVLVYIILTYNY